MSTAEDDVVAQASAMLIKFSALTGKAAKKSWGYTKKAVNQTVKVSSGFVPKGAKDQLAKAGSKAAVGTKSVRTMFLQKHSRDLHGVTEHVESDSEDEFEGLVGVDEHGKEIDIEALFDTVLSNVDQCFFDGDYKAAQTELAAIPRMRPEDDNTTGRGPNTAQLTLNNQLEDTLVKRIASQKVVQALLKKRIIANADVFLQGVRHISVINSDLKKIIIDCRRSRMTIADSKQSQAGRSLGLLSRRRRKIHLTQLNDIMVAMEDVKVRHDQFTTYLKDSKFKEAIRMTQSNRVCNVHLLENVKAVQPMLQLWEVYRRDPTFILTHVDRVIETCLAGGASLSNNPGSGEPGPGNGGGGGMTLGHRKFTIDKYLNAVEAYIALGDTSKAADMIIMSLWHFAVALFNRHLSDASVTTRGDPKDLSAIAAGIGVDHMIPTVCTLGAKLLDFALLFNTLLNCHASVFKPSPNNKEKSGGGGRSPVNGRTPSTSPPPPPREGEAGNGEGPDEDEAATITFHKDVYQFLQSLGKRIVTEFHKNIREMVDGLHVEHLPDLNKALHVFNLAILMVEATALFGAGSEEMRASRAKVKEQAMEVINANYHRERGKELLNRMSVESWECDEDIIPEMFKIVLPISPENYRQEVKTVKSYVTKHQPGSLNPFFQERFMVPGDVAEGLQIDALKGSRDRSIVTGTTGIIANRVFEYVVRVAVRFPPLASEVLVWCQELVALYFYVCAANFVSSQRTLDFSSQTDFCAETKKFMHGTLKEMALRCVPHLAGKDRDGPLFPPAVYHEIRESYASPDRHFATPQRLTAVESIFPLLDLLEECCHSVEPLLVPSVIKEHTDFLDRFRSSAEDVLRVGMFRLSSACFPRFESYIDTIGNFKFTSGRAEMQPSKYVYNIVDNLTTWIAHLRMPFPSPFLQEQFWIHFVLVLQRCLVRGYAKVRRLTDTIVSQMKIDAPAVLYNLKTVIPFSSPQQSMPSVDYCTRMLDAYFLDSDQRDVWVKEHHTDYTSYEVTNFLGETVHRQKAIENMLSYLKHEDMIPPLPKAVAAQLANSRLMSPSRHRGDAHTSTAAPATTTSSKKKDKTKSPRPPNEGTVDSKLESTSVNVANGGGKGGEAEEAADVREDSTIETCQF